MAASRKSGTAADRGPRGLGPVPSSPTVSSSRLLLACLALIVLHSTFVTVHVHRLSDARGTIDGGCAGGPAGPSSSATNDAAGNDDPAKVLVVYAGPSSKSAKKAGLYEKNAEFFLTHGVDCESSAAAGQVVHTVIVVGHEHYDEYAPRIEAVHRRCAGTADKVILVTRRAVCYDMEAPRLALYGGVPGLDAISSYDYFFMVNCGVTGPPPRPSKARASPPWTSRFVRLLDDRVRMTGLVLNCENSRVVHIMSMMYALDRVGLDIVKKAGAFYDCLDPPDNDFIRHYERRMGESILEAGYALRPLVGGEGDEGMVVSKDNLAECVPCQGQNETDAASCRRREQFKDIWIGSRLKSIYDGRIPSLEDVSFFKTSRFLSPEMARQINYTGKINWNWN